MSEAAVAAPASNTAMAEHLFRGSVFRTQTCGSECTTLWQSEQASASGELHEQLLPLRAWLGLYGRHEEGRGNTPLVVSLRLAEGTDVVYVQTQGPGGAIYEQPWRVPPAERTPYGYDTAVWASLVYRDFVDIHGPGPDWYVNLEIHDEWGDTVRYPDPKWYPPANGECSMAPFSIPAHYTVHRWTYGCASSGRHRPTMRSPA